MKFQMIHVFVSGLLTISSLSFAAESFETRLGISQSEVLVDDLMGKQSSSSDVTLGGIHEGIYHHASASRVKFIIKNQRVFSHRMTINIGQSSYPIVWPLAIRVHEDKGHFKTEGYFSFLNCNWPVTLEFRPDPVETENQWDLVLKFPSGLNRNCRYDYVNVGYDSIIFEEENP